MNNLDNELFSPDIGFATYYYENNTRHFHLTAEPIKQTIVDGIVIDALGYNGSTPGPVIVLKQGEWISLTVENKLEDPTSLHVHGLSKSNSQDGAPDIEPSTPKIMPGESFTYKFLAWQSGTFFYHAPIGEQIAQGLIGAFIVLPSGNVLDNAVIDRDYVLLLQQWQIPQQKL